MESTAKCLTGTTSVAWHREAEAGTPPQAADSLAGIVCVMEMEMEMAARQSLSLEAGGRGQERSVEPCAA